MRKLGPLIAGVLCAQVVVAEPAGASGRPSTFIDAGTFVPGLVVDMRYAGSHNFVGRPIEGYEAPRCLLTWAAADALARRHINVDSDVLPELRLPKNPGLRTKIREALNAP